MNEYCTRGDVRNRLTERGYQFVAARGKSGVVTIEDQERYVDTAIEYAGRLIDGAVSKQLEPRMARGQRNAWLRDRAVDIAAHRVATHGGRRALQTLKDDSDESKELLRGVKDGDRVPGLILDYRAPSAQMPRAINPSLRGSSRLHRRIRARRRRR